MIRISSAPDQCQPARRLDPRINRPASTRRRAAAATMCTFTTRSIAYATGLFRRQPAVLQPAVDAGAGAVYAALRNEANARAFPGLNFSGAKLAQGIA
ncbi:MAG TPA: hypothetical protein VF738_05985 [Rhodanobacter sp.]